MLRNDWIFRRLSLKPSRFIVSNQVEVIMKKDRHYKLGDNFIKMAPDQLIKLNRWLLVLFMAIEVVTWLARRGSHNVMVITLPFFCCAVIIYPIMRWVKWRKTTSKSHFHFSKDDFSGGWGARFLHCDIFDHLSINCLFRSVGQSHTCLAVIS